MDQFPRRRTQSDSDLFSESADSDVLKLTCEEWPRIRRMEQRAVGKVEKFKKYTPLQKGEEVLSLEVDENVIDSLKNLKLDSELSRTDFVEISSVGDVSERRRAERDRPDTDIVSKSTENTVSLPYREWRRLQRMELKATDETKRRKSLEKELLKYRPPRRRRSRDTKRVRKRPKEKFCYA